MGLVLVLSSGVVYASHQDVSSVSQFEVIPTSEGQHSYTQNHFLGMSVDSKGVTRTLSLATKPTMSISLASPEKIATDFLSAKKGILFTNAKVAERAEFVVESSTQTMTGTKVRFTQMVSGLPVYQSTTLVNVGPSQQVDFVSNNFQSFSPLLSTKAGLISTEEALQAVQKHFNISATLSSYRSQRMIYASTGSPRVVEVVRFAAPAAGLYDWEVLVDAQTKEIVRAEDLTNHRHAKPKGRDENKTAPAFVYDPNPIVKTGKKYGADGLVDNDGADSEFLNGLRDAVILPEITPKDGKFYLISKYAQLEDSEEPKLGDFASTKANFECTRGQTCFQAVNAFFFIDKSLRYVNETLGVKAMPYQYSGGIKFDPQGENGADNSHYSSFGGNLVFGQGGIDDAEDHDVVLHELGHAIHDFVTKGHLARGEGLSEGFGDYWAVSYSRSLNRLKPENEAYGWVFTWDGHNDFWPGRVVNSTGKYPTDAQGEIHDAGQIFASTMMQVWDALGKEVADRLTLEGLALTVETAKQQDAITAILKADKVIYQGAHLVQLKKIFSERGYKIISDDQS